MTKYSKGEIIFILFRIITYLPMLIDTFWGILISFVADFLDSYILYYFKVPEKKYHHLDKPLDYILYILIFFLSFNTPIFYLILGLIIYRTIGMSLYNITKRRIFFLITPNFIEFVFLIYLFDIKFGYNYLSDIRTWIVLIIFKLIQEFLLHAANIGEAYSGWKLLKLPTIDTFKKRNMIYLNVNIY